MGSNFDSFPVGGHANGELLKFLVFNLSAEEYFKCKMKKSFFGVINDVPETDINMSFYREVKVDIVFNNYIFLKLK